MKYAIIGGTNIETLPISYREQAVSTPYGDAVINYAKLEDGTEILFVPRHGVFHAFDAAGVNYRANIFALKMIGVTNVIGISNVVTCDYTAHVGSLCLISDFLDFTKSRPSTFRLEDRVHRHTGMEDVFDPAMNDLLENIIIEKGIPYAGRNIYACTEGPRFETAAEVRMYRMLGAQVIGMTVVPEAPLCRELEMKYAAIGIITSYSTGMADMLSDTKINRVFSDDRSIVFDLCFETIKRANQAND